MASKSSSIVSQEEFNSFHKIDRDLYTLLVFKLFRDPSESMEIMALWLWLESAGFPDVVKKMLSLPFTLINELADETVTCLDCITSTHQSQSALNHNNKNNILLIQSFIEKEISLSFFHQHRVVAARGVTEILTNVCARALNDIVKNTTKRNTNDNEKAIETVREMMILGDPDDRTMFLTFSKGYPLNEYEVREFFTRVYGDCVESLHMQEVQPSKQPLFARLIFHSASTIDLILGGSRKLKFTINGKHVWTRKFIRKHKEPSKSMLPPPPSPSPRLPPTI